VYFLSTPFLGHINQPCDLPEDSQDGLFIAAKDGTVVLSDNMDARGDMRHKMPSGNNTVNVFLNVPALPQLQRGTGNDKSTVDNFPHSVLYKMS